MILENTYPMPDEVGLRQSPYTFTVKNEEKSRGVGISIIIEVISTSTLSDDLVHVAIEDEVRSLSSENTETPSEATYKSAYNIYDFDLSPGESKTYNLRAWINSAGTIDNAQNKTWSARVLVVPGVPASEKTLQALNITVKNDVINFANPASTPASAGVYALPDSGGTTSYFFRGPVENNYVRFGTWANDTEVNDTKAGQPMFWRIIRGNGDGSLRMIYAGTSAHPNIDQGEDTFIGTSAFNKGFGDAKYVGYMYSPTSTTEFTSKEQAQTNTESSTIKGVLETWYDKNLKAYDEYISKDTIYCYDRSINAAEVNNKGFGRNTTYYAAMSRFISDTTRYVDATPIFECAQANDKFTSKNSHAEIGNKKLEYLVGLITADEIVAAGSGKQGTESSYYLKRSSSYWSGSPANCINLGGVFHAAVFHVRTNGLYVDFTSSKVNSLAPVISLTKEAARALVGTGVIGDEFHLPAE